MLDASLNRLTLKNNELITFLSNENKPVGWI